MTWDLPNHPDVVDHVALQVKDIDAAVHWYEFQFWCEVKYLDANWALLQFAHMWLALVVADQPPPHIGFVSEDAETFGPLKPHRDGTRSTYMEDPFGNTIEILAATPVGGK